MWTNYETWLTNEEIEEAAQAVTEYDYYKICGRLCERLKDQVAEFQEMENNCTGLFSDLLGAALARVDWYEIADNWLSDLVEEVKRNA